MPYFTSTIDFKILQYISSSVLQVPYPQAIGPLILNDLQTSFSVDFNNLVILDQHMPFSNFCSHCYLLRTFHNIMVA